MRYLKMGGFGLAGVLVAAAACGQTFGIVGQKPSDVMFTEQGLKATISGFTMQFEDGSEAQYFRNHHYVFTSADGVHSYDGKWHIFDHWQVCVQFNSGLARCDTYIRSARQIVFIAANGHRFSVRSRTAINKLDP